MNRYDISYISFYVHDRRSKHAAFVDLDMGAGVFFAPMFVDWTCEEQLGRVHCALPTKVYLVYCSFFFLQEYYRFFSGNGHKIACTHTAEAQKLMKKTSVAHAWAHVKKM